MYIMFHNKAEDSDQQESKQRKEYKCKRWMKQHVHVLMLL